MYAKIGVHPGPAGPEEQITTGVVYTDGSQRQHDIMLLQLPNAIFGIPWIDLPDCANRYLAKLSW